MKYHLSVRRSAEAAVIAALYTALTMLVPAASFGTVQLRVAEALTLLPVLTPAAIPGLTLGCFLSNLFGLTLGANVAGAWDLLFGTAATLAAAVLTRAWRGVRLKNRPVLSALPPIFCNALVIGLELNIVLFGFSPLGYALCAAEVAVGQTLACVLGLLLVSVLEKSGAAKKLFAE